MGERVLKTETVSVNGMTCVSCKKRIEKRLKAMAGVEEADVNYVHGTAKVKYDGSIVDLDRIAGAIEELDYTVERRGGLGGRPESRRERDNLMGVLLIIFALFLFLNHGGGGILARIFNFFPQAEKGMGYGALFAVGLLTSVHCVAMCGGINISQCLGQCKGESLKPSFLYNSGRVISYTAVGGIVGAIGSVISFSGAAKGIVQIAAGVFMVIMGINMLGMFKSLRGLAPRMPEFLTKKIESSRDGKGPLYVGLLNGLMPCGPLQAMQLYALYTGNPFKGALSMFFFSLGTVPLMFGLGAFSSMMGKKFTSRALKYGAGLIIVMGVVMFNNGVSLSGIGSPQLGGSQASALSAAPVASGSGAVQEITTPLPRFGYPSITVKAGVPVKWNLKAERGTINGCNNTVVIPSFGIEKRLQTGDNIIEFTPLKSGRYRYSCWMGMIRGMITVVDGETPDKTAALPMAEAGELAGAGPSSGNSDQAGLYEDDDSSAYPKCRCCSPRS
ncbi:MAG: sulfite exporter TauE/SafE family protein [Synergistaceae bacterium]|jgi:sulfite exporter TauE/SafE/copper chaperone CopZ|nr:sulfite exporter TauE/SafE family protein [Synergistaceae bacterium]